MYPDVFAINLNSLSLSLHHYHRRLKVLCIFVKAPTCADPENCVKVGWLFFVSVFHRGTYIEKQLGHLPVLLSSSGVKYFEKYSNTYQLLSLMNVYNYITVTRLVKML